MLKAAVPRNFRCQADEDEVTAKSSKLIGGPDSTELFIAAALAANATGCAN